MATEEEQVKAFLRQYLECEREIEVRAEELARCRCLAVKTTGAIGGERVQGSRKNRLEETIERIVELEEALLEQVERLRGTKEAVDRAIAAVDSGEQRAVLQMRYLAGKNWEETGDALGYSLRHAARLHNLAVKELAGRGRFVKVGDGRHP
ncbi:sigma-70 family RNA polymerase sigma factor [Bittarella massiliensis]|uniref:sigma-70 family RNA polymerase sigma factor n=1 Tax=Bittarella massiliensis (ex Durand et al. 2017) TaxID=1720313 RepID=UPI00163B6E33|nr:sigma-70 family RNA polymerase sigma factor [Bittarella massiliensis (ex Durand et al. 2017)]MBC2871191.1 sigma-70 family RNA polymerase sigma factor [Bittarella massiliensis (ex Durand et al. 2017)]